jgi:hypothetical protein
MRRAILVLAMLSVAAAPASPVASLAGRYSHTERDPLRGDRLDSVMEIVPVDATHAYVRIALQQPNGMSCGVSGVASAAGTGLAYTARDATDDGQRCTFTISRQGRELIIDDTDSQTCRAYCGVNAMLSDGFALSSKRPITYLMRLKRSREYRAALAEWRRQPAGY